MKEAGYDVKKIAMNIICYPPTRQAAVDLRQGRSRSGQGWPARCDGEGDHAAIAAAREPRSRTTKTNLPRSLAFERPRPADRRAECGPLVSSAP